MNKLLRLFKPIRVVVTELSMIYKNIIRIGISKEKIYSEIKKQHGVDMFELEKNRERTLP